MTGETRIRSGLNTALAGLALAIAALLVSCALCAVTGMHDGRLERTSPALAGIAFADGYTAGQTDISTTPTTWSDFRGSSTNNAVTQAATPRTSSEAGIIWGRKFSDGYVCPMIIVDDAVVVTYGRKSGVIAKLNKDTGATIATGSMSGASLYSLIPPTYADGKIFVTLSNGGLEAFDADTLKSLWYHQNASGGQGNCTITYSDGYVYTGYWSGETATRNFVCIDASTGKQVWSMPNVGGYYWVGAVVVGDYLLFGCDDGKAANTVGTSYLKCVNKRTGEVVSELKLKGDQRSSIAYDADLGRVYFTTKPGYLYSALVNASSGKLSGLKSLKLDVESTATPLVYGGRVYVGSSSGSFAAGKLSVVDASSLQLLCQFDGNSGISGTVKSAPLVSTAYAGSSSSNKLYLYFTCNNPPGGITALSISPSSTEASVIDLFTPPDSMSEYCICSVICDNSGHLYYKNDSNCLVCIGPGGTKPANYTFPSSGSSSSGGSSSGGSSSGSGSSSDSGSSSGSSSSGGSTSGSSTSGSSSSGSSTSGSSTSGSSTSGSSTSGSSTSGSSTSGSSTSGSSTSGSSTSGSATTKSGVTATTGSSTGSTTTKTTGASTNGASGTSASTKSKGSANKDSASKTTKPTGSGNSGQSAKPGTAGGTGSSTSKSDSDRHTDAEAATKHLEEAEGSSLPPWTAPAIALGIALAAFAGLAIVRVYMARRDANASTASNRDANGGSRAQ